MKTSVMASARRYPYPGRWRTARHLSVAEATSDAPRARRSVVRHSRGITLASDRSGGIHIRSSSVSAIPTRVAVLDSFAAPQVAGLIALILSKHPGLTPFQVKTILAACAVNAPGRLPVALGAPRRPADPRGAEDRLGGGVPSLDRQRERDRCVETRGRALGPRLLPSLRFEGSARLGKVSSMDPLVGDRR